MKKILSIIYFLSWFCLGYCQIQTRSTHVNPDWVKPYPPFRIVGNLYYVGTYELASYLVVTDKGSILINTGLASSASQIKDNIESLGFKFSSIKILLTNQAHYDHVGAMAEIKKATGAKMMIDEGDVASLEDGGHSDYVMNDSDSQFLPIQVDRILHNKDTIGLGKMKIILLHHPGHTQGSCSFLFRVDDEKKSYTILIANLPTIIVEKPFSKVNAYPKMADDYAYTFKAMKNLSFDIWLSPHASLFDLHKKRDPGSEYNPSVFMDRIGYDLRLKELELKYTQKLKEN